MASREREKIQWLWYGVCTNNNVMRSPHSHYGPLSIKEHYGRTYMGRCELLLFQSLLEKVYVDKCGIFYHVAITTSANNRTSLARAAPLLKSILMLFKMVYLLFNLIINECIIQEFHSWARYIHIMLVAWLWTFSFCLLQPKSYVAPYDTSRHSA